MKRVNETRLTVHRPGPQFDDALLGLARCLTARGLSFGEITPERLAEAGALEQKETAENQERLAEAKRREGEYLLARDGRAEMLLKALAMARAAARLDPELLRELKAFSLRSKSKRAGASTPSPGVGVVAITEAAKQPSPSPTSRVA